MGPLIERIRRWLSHHSNFRAVLIFILALLCAFEFDAVFRGLRTADQNGDPYLSYHHGQIVRELDPVKPSDIQPWMTFQYINFIFKLPKNYLADALVLSDDRYPNVQVARYAKVHGLDSVTFLAKVRGVVEGYTTQTF